MISVHCPALRKEELEGGGYWKLEFVRTEMKRAHSGASMSDMQPLPPPPPMEEEEREEVTTTPSLSVDPNECTVVMADPPWFYANNSGQGCINFKGWRYKPMTLDQLLTQITFPTQC